MKAKTTRVIMNPAARGEKASRILDEVRGLAHGLDVRITKSPEDARRFAAEAVSDGMELIVAAGGDGTINQVVNGIDGGDVTLGILPAGTMNVFAAELGLPQSIQQAWKTIVAGHTRNVDLARAGTRKFVQLAGIGLDAQVVQETSWEFRKNFGPMSYVVSAAQIASRKPPLLQVEVEGHEAMTGSFVLIGNGRYYGGPVPIFKEARMDDGLLDLLIFKNLGFLDLIRYLQGVLFGTHVDMPDVEYFQAPFARIISEDQGVPVEVDGEVIGELPVDVALEPGGLRVLVPRPKQ